MSFSQYWKACTAVIARIPPAATMPATSTATRTPPVQDGRSVTTPSASDAPCNCGTMYSHPITSTTTLVTRRTPRDSSRASTKSGIV